MKYKERNLQTIKSESVFEWNEAEKQNAYKELQEVYRKAEAFDRVKQDISESIEVLESTDAKESNDETLVIESCKAFLTTMKDFEDGEGSQ